MNRPPAFPRSRPLLLEDKELVDSFLKKYPPSLSEFTFTNLFAWRRAYQFGLAMLDDFLLIVSLKEEGAIRVFDPLGPMNKKKQVIVKCFAAGPWGLKFTRLPEETVSFFGQEAFFKIEEDRDNFDYIYNTCDLVELKGKKFDAKRNFIKRFKDEYVFDYKKLTPENLKDCLFFQEEWCLAKDCQHIEGLSREKEAMQEMLTNFTSLGICGGMIEVKSKVEALTLGEPLAPETFVVHIEKANGAFIGIYQTINQVFCQREVRRYKYINREQDLGVPGLRQAKESYHPSMMIKKYSLSSID